MIYRLGGVLVVLLGFAVGYIAVGVPMGFRSANTGFPTSGPFGWFAAALVIFGGAMIYGGKAMFERSKDDEESDAG